MIFWAITFVICGITTVIFYLSIIQKAPEITSNSDLEVYKDQLINIDSELTRGIITADEGERIKAEVGRRILDLGKRKQFPFKKETKLLGIILSICFLVILGLGGSVIYQKFGAPGYANISQNQRIKNADKLIKGRATQEQLLALRIDEPSLITPEGNYGELVQKLRQKVAERPTDLEGLKLLTGIETKIGNIDGAVKSQRQFLEVLGNNASDIDFFNYADLLINQVDGVVSPQADKALRSALEINPQNGGAKYYIGLMLAQNDRPDLAIRLWKQLLNKDDIVSPWIPLIRADIERLAVLAGDTKFKLPTMESIPGPTSEDIENASSMTESEREDMIRGMVSRLSERLSTKGGNPNEWARLINALGILGEFQNANSVWEEAKNIFKGSPNALIILSNVADKIGLR
jgi:cytochrome c-type biogenesis protein CcmH